MSIKIIQERLSSYQCQSEEEEKQALWEITQEVVLAGLGRGDFFKHALFQGGTCLRIFYGLNRFSEDLDFILSRPDPEFDIYSHLQRVVEECKAFGFFIKIQDRKQAVAAIKQTFLKDDSLARVLDLTYPRRTGRMGSIRIKFEVDTNPPEGFGKEMKYLDFPFVSMVALQDKPSLFAGKIHALLCREYIKGRDWYDFIWYTSQKINVNFNFLSAALDQQGPWQGRGPQVDLSWCVRELTNKIKSMNWLAVANDVRRFLRPSEYPSLDLWSEDLFLHQLKKMASGPTERKEK